MTEKQLSAMLKNLEKAQASPNRWPERIRKCVHCNNDYKSKSSHSKYCEDCVPRDAVVIWNRRIKWYGIGKKDWDKMAKKSNGLCQICLIKEATDVEHCHKTGKVRGIVCTQCNKGLAFLDNSEWLKSAIKFINKQ